MERQRWNSFQKETAKWRNRVIPPELNTPEGEFKRSLEEVGELTQAVEKYDGSRTSELEVAGEATDVIIRMLGIISAVNVDAGDMLREKIASMKQKYPAGVIERQLAQGVPHDQVMREHKTAWENPGQAKVITLFPQKK